MSSKKFFSIRIPTHVTHLLQNEMLALVNVNCTIPDVWIIHNISEDAFIQYASKNKTQIFTIDNFRIVNGIVQCTLSYPDSTHTVGIFALPSPVVYSDRTLSFSVIQARAVSYMVSVDKAIFVWDADVRKFLDDKINCLKLSALPSVSQEALSSPLPLPVSAAGCLSAETLQSLKDIFKNETFDATSIALKLESKQNITNRDLILFGLMTNNIIDVQNDTD